MAQYVAAGASVIYTPTLGANPIKLREYGLEKDVLRRSIGNWRPYPAGPRMAVPWWRGMSP